uniref:NB-ARC domain-containing protein n=1 Tax=Leersia perrieri TaxID=77586 RepID=A0A0D9XU67_9ORYZ
MEAVKDRLSLRLNQIQAVYDAVDRQQINEQSDALDKWLWRFRDAVELAEDVLDEIEYYELEEEVRAQNLDLQVRNPAIEIFKENFVHKVAKYTSEGYMIKNLRKAVKRLDEIAADVDTFLHLTSRSNSSVLPDYAEKSIQQIGSTLVATEIFGRDSEKNKVMGITKKILEALIEQKPSVNTLEALQQILKKNLNPKKFLLILDDVWEDNKRDEWEILLAPLQNSQNGSKILLTTRMKSVADMATSVMGSKKNYLHLNGLYEDENFILFKKYAFYDIRREDYEHLLPIAKEIVKKFRGCPLVTKIAGEHLRSNASDHHWNNLYRQLENLEEKIDVIIATVLRSSYCHLPEHLQVCFRYCSIFPIGYEFNKDEIVKMWMGSGLIITDSGTERPEDIGERYLVQLARKSFFTFVQMGDPYSKYYREYYVMHDLLHELARNVSAGECLRLDSGGYRHKKCTLCNLENVENHEEVIEAKLRDKPYLRSLSLNWSETNNVLRNDDDLVLDKLEPHSHLEYLEIAGYNGVRFPTWISHLGLTNMVSLELRNCKNWAYLPALGNLKLLKHLELHKLVELEHIGQSSDNSLPPNLKTLVVEGCIHLGELPLLPPSLTQLEVNHVGLTTLPRIYDHHGNNSGLGTETKLISVIIINCSNLVSLEESFLLQESHIRSLQILSIVDCEKLIRAPLLFSEMDNLVEFHIGECYRLKMMENDNDVLLPSTLKELSIVQCGDLQLPLLGSLFGLTNLTSLSLYCTRAQSLPSADVFRSLKALREMVATGCTSLASLGGLGALSYLTWLEIVGCPKLEVSARCDGDNGMGGDSRRLWNIGILNEFGRIFTGINSILTKFREKPHIAKEDSVLESPQQVYSLWIGSPSMLDMEPLKRLCNTKGLIISLAINSIPREWLRQNSMSLETLEILKPETRLLLQDLRSLKRLEFDTVDGDLEFPVLPSSLESFIVRGCNPGLVERWKRKGSSEWNKLSQIRHISEVQGSGGRMSKRSPLSMLTSYYNTGYMFFS